MITKQKSNELHTERTELTEATEKLLDAEHLEAEQIETVKTNTARVKEITQLLASEVVQFGDGESSTSTGYGTPAEQPRLIAGDFIDVSTGKRANLRKGESLTAAFKGIDPDADNRAVAQYGSVGRLMAALSTSGASAVVPTTWSQQVLDLVVAQSAIGQAGSTTIPMIAKTVEIGRITGDPTAAFRAEGSQITASDPSFDNVTLNAHTMNALVITSVEWLQDAENASDLIQRTLVQSMAQQLDRVALYGGQSGHGLPVSLVGAEFPNGILTNLLANAPANVLGNATNGTTQTSTAFWGEILDTVYTVRDNNFEPNALVWGSKAARTYAKATDTMGRYLTAPATLPTIFQSNNVGQGYTQGTLTTAADVFTGDFSNLLIGLRSNLQLQTLNDRYADTGQVGFLATWRGDIQLAHPGAFAAYIAIKGS